MGDLFEQLTIDKGLFEIGLYPNGYIPLLFRVNDFLQTLWIYWALVDWSRDWDQSVRIDLRSRSGPLVDPRVAFGSRGCTRFRPLVTIK